MKTETQLAFDEIPSEQLKSDLLDNKAKQEMVQIGGRIAQILGIPRSTGQILGLLYFSSEPLSLAEMCSMLGLSKASTSTGTRQLASWGAIRKVWVPGDRRDFYSAFDDFGQLLKGSYRAIIKPKIGSSKSRLEKIEELLNQDLKSKLITKEEHTFMHSRLVKIKKFHEKTLNFLPLLEKLF